MDTDRWAAITGVRQGKARTAARAVVGSEKAVMAVIVVQQEMEGHTHP